MTAFCLLSIPYWLLRIAYFLTESLLLLFLHGGVGERFSGLPEGHQMANMNYGNTQSTSDQGPCQAITINNNVVLVNTCCF